ADAMNRPAPPVYELRWSRANAGALVNQGWVLFTSRAAELLEPVELEAVAAHELGHLSESHRVRLIRSFSALIWMPMVAGLLGTQGGQQAYFVMGLLGTALLGVIYKRFVRKLEHRADAVAHAVDGQAYARALEKLHRSSMVPAVLRSGTHPGLYDRLVAAGIT